MSTQFVLQSAVSFPVGLWIESPIHFAYQGCTEETFKIFLYTEDDEPHRVDLYAQGSNSIPWQVPQNKWSHLNPQWRFTDLSGNIIDNITLSNTITTQFNGTTGYLASAEFYYVDDMPTHKCETILIWAVVDFSQYPVQKDIHENMEMVPGYANSKVVAVSPYYINSLTPTYLDVTRDGLNPMFDFYWINAPIPHVVSIMGTTENGLCSSMMRTSPPAILSAFSDSLITRSINGIPTGSLTWTPDNTNAYLSSLDYQDFIVGGYLKGKVVSEDTANSITIDASGNVYYDNIALHYPYLWISNPENNTINRVFIPNIREDWFDPSLPFLRSYNGTIYDTSYLQVTSASTNMSLTGFHGIYGMAIDRQKNLWCADAESDRIYKFDGATGALLSSISFDEGCTPAGISIDGSNNIWVTFFDSVSSVYIDKVNGSIITTINPGDPIDPYMYTVCADPVFKPVLAEPDVLNDVWITYHNSICSVMVKYTTGGSLMGTITLPSCSNPTDMFITKNNDIWVALTRHAGPPYGISTVNKYASASPYALICSIPAFNPGYLAVDNYDNLWFTQSGNILTKVTSGGIVSSWSVGVDVSAIYTPPSTEIYYENALEGLCTDICDRVWVINSIDNCLYTITDDTVQLATKILPDLNLSWYNDTSTYHMYTATNEGFKSAQAFGDWSGNRWVTKYGNVDSPYLSASLNGSSNVFNIYDFNGFDIRRFNESWDAIAKVKSFARSPHIADNPLLWDGYMKAVWGDAASEQGTGYGREAYERISNFAINHTDINACNIKQLYSLAQYTDVPIDIYGVEFPPELRRIMDIGSINQQLLWGSRCKCNRNITNTYTTYLSGNEVKETEYLCEYCGHYHPGNKGELFNPLAYMVTAFVPFIIEDRTNNNNRYQLITPPAILSSVSIFESNITRIDTCSALYSDVEYQTTYPLSGYYNILLPAVYNLDLSANWSDFQQIVNYFCFNEYIASTPCTEQIAGIINWDDPYTTLNETQSSTEDWYGNGQALERMINYVLHKGLGLIGD